MNYLYMDVYTVHVCVLCNRTLLYYYLSLSLILFSPQLGLTAADLAKEQGNEEIIKLLKNPKRAKEVSLFYY